MMVGMLLACRRHGFGLLVALVALLALPAASFAARTQAPPPGWCGDHWCSGTAIDVPDGPTPAPAPAPVTPIPLPTVTPPAPDPALVTKATVRGRVAKLRTNGKAALPRRAPKRVRAILAAGNRIVGKPYKWGGGHAKLDDRGYDCSGTVSYALIRAGLLTSPMVSGTFARWGAAGEGRWVTIYANKGHVYMEVAGLRLDTSAVADPRGGSGPRWRPVTGHRSGFRTRHVLGL
jgi:hypothetical protein